MTAAQITAELEKLRSEIAHWKKIKNTAAADFRNTSSPSAEVIRDQASDKVEKLEAQRDDYVRRLGLLQSSGSSDAGTGTGLLIAETEDVRLRMSSSSMAVGRVALGEAASRDQLIAQIGGAARMMAAAPDTDVTPAMREGTFRGIVPQLRRPLTLLDLFPSAGMDGASFDYVSESGSLDTAAEQAEGAVKAASAAVFTDETAHAETVAHYTKLKKQSLSDSAGLQGVIENRLTYGVLRRLEKQILAGTGHDNGQIQGLLATSGIGSVVYDADELAADQTLEGIVTVLLSDATPNFVALNPRDWANMIKAKAAPAGDGQYYSPGPFQLAEIAHSLWGCPTVPSAAVTLGGAIVGDAILGATVMVREGVQVLVSDSDQDDFVRNRVTLLGEGRFGLAVWYPSAFCTVDFTA